MKKKVSFTIVMSTYQISDVFFAVSAFLAVYKCVQIYEANGNKLGFVDTLRLYAIKFMRLAPMIYVVFLFGWALGAHLNEGPNWSNYQCLYLNCDKYWWAQFLMIGNLVPYFSELNGGCNYSSWIFYCDMQLYLVIPLYVIVYKRSPKIGVFLQFFMILTNSAVLMWMSAEFNFRGSPLAPEGYYIFSYIVNKPYMKFQTHSIGVLTAFAYIELVKYRKLQSEEDKKSKHPFLHFWM